MRYNDSRCLPLPLPRPFYWQSGCPLLLLSPLPCSCGLPATPRGRLCYYQTNQSQSVCLLNEPSYTPADNRAGKRINFTRSKKKIKIDSHDTLQSGIAFKSRQDDFKYYGYHRTGEQDP